MDSLKGIAQVAVGIGLGLSAAYLLDLISGIIRHFKKDKK